MASRHKKKNESFRKPAAERPEQRKERECLMCGRQFVSEHYGERICRACKSTAAWREGTAA